MRRNSGVEKLVRYRFVMPGHSRPKDGVASACLRPGINVLWRKCKKDVDGRAKPGHDERR
jgi:hypothetical protein